MLATYYFLQTPEKQFPSANDPGNEGIVLQIQASNWALLKNSSVAPIHPEHKLNRNTYYVIQVLLILILGSWLSDVLMRNYLLPQNLAYFFDG